MNRFYPKMYKKNIYDINYDKLKEIGVGFVDSPVSGGEPKAIDGTLAFMAGGDEKDFDALSDYEILCKIFEYFDKQIKAVDDKYSGLGDKVDELENSFNQLKIDIARQLSTFETSIKNDVNIAVFGIFGDDALDCVVNPPLEFKNPVEAAKETVAEI
mgnify:CR=1 FL=1